jgi:acyl-CoA thioesterase FadM
MSAPRAVLRETYRGVVAPWECDVMGHLTIAQYFDRLGDAALNLIETIAPAKAPPQAAWRSTRLFIRYQRELRAGDGLFVLSGVIGEEGASIRIGHELSDAETQEICTLGEHTLAPRDLPYGGLGEQRRVLALAAVPWSTPGFQDEAPEIAEDRLIETGSDRIKAWEVDERGELSLSGFVHRFANACLHVCSSFGMTPAYMRQEKRGFSTFETRLHLCATPPGAGDSVVVRSALLGVGKSSLHMVHDLRLSRTGERLALCYQSGVHFDLEARRSAALPADLRERASSLAGA